MKNAFSILHALYIHLIAQQKPMEKTHNSPEEQPNNPLHGIKLSYMLEQLVEYYGWETLSRKININCFKNDPSIKSSLKFLRKTPWARAKVEDLYLLMEHEKEKAK